MGPIPLKSAESVINLRMDGLGKRWIEICKSCTGGIGVGGGGGSGVAVVAVTG